MRLRLAFLAIVPSCLLACATTHTAVRDLAAQELACPRDAIDLAHDEGHHVYRASGCGASVRIACYDPNDSTGAQWGWADPLTAGNRVRCERIIDRPQATTTNATVPAPAPKAGEFDKALAAKLLGAAADRARTCSVPGGVSGPGRAHITFAGDGTVTAVDLDAPFRDTEVGRCVVREMQRSSTTAFTGGPVTVAKSFEVRAPALPQ